MSELMLINADDPTMNSGWELYSGIDGVNDVTVIPKKDSTGPFKYVRGSIHKIYVEKAYMDELASSKPNGLIEFLIGGLLFRAIEYPKQSTTTPNGELYELDVLDGPLPTYAITFSSIHLKGLDRNKIWLLVDTDAPEDTPESIEIPYNCNDDMSTAFDRSTNSNERTMRILPNYGLAGLTAM